MAHVIAGLFDDSKSAGDAVAELKDAGFVDDISIIAKEDDDSQIKSHQVKSSGSVGGGAGAVVGGLAGLLLGTGSVIVPGLGALLVAGPFTAFMGATGALAGGLVGFLVDVGIPEERAIEYEEAIKNGGVLVAVTADHRSEKKIRTVFEKHGVDETDTRHNFTSM